MSDKLTIRNSVMFALVMNNEEFCLGVLERILGRKIEKVRYLKKYDLRVEETLIAAIASKKIRVDVKFEDDDDWYDIEMQAYDDREELPKRTRYYHAVFDVKQLPPGADYSDLKKSYVIFICTYDQFELGKAMYSFSMYDKEKDLYLGDETFTIILNSRAYDDPLISEDLRALLKYVDNGQYDSGDELISGINEYVLTTGAGEVGETIMTISEEIERMHKRAKEAESRADEAESRADEAKNRADQAEKKAASLEKLYVQELKAGGLSRDEAVEKLSERLPDAAEMVNRYW